MSDLGPVGGEAAYLAAHAVLGCAASAAEGTGCAGGAIGGAASAAISPLVIGQLDPTGAPPTPEQAAITTAIAMLAGGGLAGALGQNVNGAATSAENEALNNTLDHVLPGQLNEPGTQTDVAKVTESPLPQGAPTPYEEDNEDVVTVGTAPLFSAVAGGSPNAPAFTIDPGTARTTGAIAPQTALLVQVPIRFILLAQGLRVDHCHRVIQWLRAGYRLMRRVSGLRLRALRFQVELGQVVVYT